MINIINGSTLKLIKKITKTEKEKTLNKLKSDYAEVCIDSDGDIIVYND